MALTHLLLGLVGAAALSLTFFSSSDNHLKSLLKLVHSLFLFLGRLAVQFSQFCVHVSFAARLADKSFWVYFTEAGEIGVCYGMMDTNIMKPPAVVQLLKQNSITMVRLYDANATALSALANTGIKVSISLPNPNLKDAATSMPYALNWVQTNVKAFPDTLIDSVAVGNEVFHQAPGLTSQLLPAMKNIQTALASVGMADTVKVSTPIALDALKVPSYPPSLGEFQDDIAQSVMSPMIDFLDQTGSYLSFNIYPYFAYKNNPSIDLDFILFRPNDGKLDSGTNLMYYNEFDAMLDAVYHAVEKLGNSHENTRGRMLRGGKQRPTKFVESGLPAKGSKGSSLKHPTSDLGQCVSCEDSVGAASKENAQTYNSNLIKKVISGTGTPYYPDADISGYIFSLFNENMKTGEEESNFGLFYPNNGTPVYQVDFVHPGPAPSPSTSWCTANAAVGDKRLQTALDYACDNGADCSAIQPGKPCYQPNSAVAHASYAFNDYYQRKNHASGTCDFAGAASIVYQKPIGTCDAGSWCVAKETVGDTRLQAALDYACSHGADCTAIQPGGRCFDPNTKVAHASYAFNDYYQRNGQSDQSCDFGGAGSIVHQQPKLGNCALQPRA